MKKFERIEIIPTFVPNTKTFGIYKEGELRWYEIKAEEGYLLHNKALDYIKIDEETLEQIHCLGYSENASSCPLNYEFNESQIIDENNNTFIVYGKFEFFTVSKEMLIK